MVDAIDIQSQDTGYATLVFEDRMKLAVDYVYQKKYNTKVQRLIKMAKFRITNAAYNDIYYIDRGLDRQKLMTLSNCQFIDTNTSVIFHGFSGAGKSFLACGVPSQARIISPVKVRSG